MYDKDKKKVICTFLQKASFFCQKLREKFN